MYRAKCELEHVNYEISYFDPDLTPEQAKSFRFMPDLLFEDIAKQAGGRVTGGRKCEHQDTEAEWGEITAENGYLAKVLVLHVLNRVYLLICERNISGIELEFDAFKRFFEIDDDLLPAKPMSVETIQQKAEAEGFEGCYEFRVNGGKPPYRWECSRIPAGLRASADGDSYWISGTIKEALRCDANVIVEDCRGTKVTSTIHWRIAAIPANAGLITCSGASAAKDEVNGDVWVFSLRIGERMSQVMAKVESGESRKNTSWKCVSGALPPGISTRDFITDLRFEGIPTKTGRYEVDLMYACEFVLFPGRVCTSKARIVFKVWGPAAWSPKLENRLGGVTLFVIDTDWEPIYSHYNGLANCFADIAYKPPEGRQLNAWSLSSGKCNALLKVDQPVEPGEKAAWDLRVALHNLHQRKTGSRNLESSLASIDENSIRVYDSLILYIQFADDELRGEKLAGIKKQFQRLAGLKGVKVHLISVRADPADEFEAWLTDQGIDVFSYVP